MPWSPGGLKASIVARSAGEQFVPLKEGDTDLSRPSGESSQPPGLLRSAGMASEGVGCRKGRGASRNFLGSGSTPGSVVQVLDKGTEL